MKDSKLSSFADDTRIGRKISTLNDCNLLQEDLNRIIRWSEDNNMKLYENKFELVCYRTPASGSLSEELPFMSDITNYTTPNGSAIERIPLVRDLGARSQQVR